MSAGQLHIKLERGAVYRRTLNLTRVSDGQPFDTAGYTARLRILEDDEAVDALLEVDLTIPSAGEVVLEIPTATTVGITWREAVHRVELVEPGGEVRRLLQGTVEVAP